MAKRRTLRRALTMIQASRGGPSPSEKAAFHQVSGAGRSRVKRQFFGVNDRDVDAFRERIRKHISDEIRKR